MEQAEFHHHVGPENICPHVQAALERAEALHHSSRGPGPAGHREVA
jgi:hypothetical protein